MISNILQINYLPSDSNFKSFTSSLEHFFSQKVRTILVTKYQSVYFALGDEKYSHFFPFIFWMNWSVPFLICLTFNYTGTEFTCFDPTRSTFGHKNYSEYQPNKIYTSIYWFMLHQRFMPIFEDPKIGFGTGQDPVKMHLFSPFYYEENQVTVG